MISYPINFETKKLKERERTMASENGDEEAARAVAKFLKDIQFYVGGDDLKLLPDNKKSGKDRGTSFVTKGKKEIDN